MKSLGQLKLFITTVQSSKRWFTTSTRALGSNHEELKMLFQGAMNGSLKVADVGHLNDEELNSRNEYGWTAVMLAARAGHANVVESLLQRKCNITLRTPSGHTAEELALFWNRRDCYNLLHKQTLHIPPSSKLFFSGSPLERAAHVRSQPSEINRFMRHANSKFALFHRLSPFVYSTTKTEKKGRKKFELFTVDLTRLTSLTGLAVADLQSKIVFLGFHQGAGLLSSGMESSGASQCPWFAYDVSPSVHVELLQSFDGIELLSPSLRLLQLSDIEAAICAQATTIMDWHSHSSFCPVCGSLNSITDAGHKLVCSNRECLTNKGGDKCRYPRLEASIVALVLHPDSRSCLLARQSRFPQRMYSCLAGFVEPGESLEDAVEREVLEEVGVAVHSVRYHASQPWPMPNVLMLGFIAQGRTKELTIDTEELEDARWFPRMEVVDMLTRQHPQGLFTPPAQALGHHLIKAWITETALTD